MLTNVSKVSEALNKTLGPIGFGLSVASDAAALINRKESPTTAGVNTAINYAAWRIPEVGVAVGGIRVGQAMQNIPVGGGNTVGSAITKGTASLINGPANDAVRSIFTNTIETGDY
jgi:hypothetical protein